eukprot:UN3103
MSRSVVFQAGPAAARVQSKTRQWPCLSCVGSRRCVGCREGSAGSAGLKSGDAQCSALPCVFPEALSALCQCRCSSRRASSAVRRRGSCVLSVSPRGGGPCSHMCVEVAMAVGKRFDDGYF